MRVQNKRWASSVIIRNAGQQVVLIRDRRKKDPLYWKLPGGKNEGCERNAWTAKREVQEETGLIIPTRLFINPFEIKDTNHTRYLFTVDLPVFEGLAEEGEDGEEIGMFNFNDLQSMKDFHPEHLQLLKAAEIIT